MLTEDNITKAEFCQSFAELDAEQQAAINPDMQATLRDLDLTKKVVSVPAPLAGAISTLQASTAGDLVRDDDVAGHSRARSLEGLSRTWGSGCQCHLWV
jgi:hypothetical protein